MYEQFKFGKRLKALMTKAEKKIAERHQEVNDVVEQNQWRIMQVFREFQISDFHFTPSTGYGYDDVGRDTLESVYATAFGAEAGLVRPQIISGTHAIATALFGVLRPGDELMYMTGQPYDTLEEVIGVRGKGKGSLMEHGVTYQAIPLTDHGTVDYERVRAAINEKTKVIGIQRSKGYANRPSFSISQIQEMIQFVKEIKSDVVVFVDNCYGEFVETQEPCHVGADLMAGSLIKNPGGGIVKTGGYLVGKSDYIDLASYRLSAPGIGKEGGASLYSLLEMYQGFFLAPHVVGQALKGAIFTSAFLEELGLNTRPNWQEARTDLIQSVQFDDAEMMISFCQAVQKASPINSHVTPYPSPMPGYEDKVIMAAGTFIQGASIELTADGPLRPPYVAYVQGGLTYEHVKLAAFTAIHELVERNLLMLEQVSHD